MWWCVLFVGFAFVVGVQIRAVAAARRARRLTDAILLVAQRRWESADVLQRYVDVRLRGRVSGPVFAAAVDDLLRRELLQSRYVGTTVQLRLNPFPPAQV